MLKPEERTPWLDKFQEVNPPRNEFDEPATWLDDQDGERVYEWHHGGRVLNVHVLETGTEFLACDGANINSDMFEGKVDHPETMACLWAWLVRQWNVP